MSKIKISIDYINSINDQRKWINCHDLNDIEFVDKDFNPIEIDPKILKDFIFTGLNNMEFITTNFYKDGFSESDEILK